MFASKREFYCMGDDSLNSSNFFISSLEQFFPLEKVRPMLSFEKKKKKREGRKKSTKQMTKNNKGSIKEWPVKSSWASHLGDTQKLSGHGLQQPVLGVPAWAGCWTRWLPRSLPAATILWHKFTPLWAEPSFSKLGYSGLRRCVNMNQLWMLAAWCLEECSLLCYY